MNPYYDNAASGMIVGWRQKHGRDELFRAVEEGICFEFKLAMEGIQAASGERINEYVILGGGSNSDLWCQTAADILGATVTPSPHRRGDQPGRGDPRRLRCRLVPIGRGGRLGHDRHGRELQARRQDQRCTTACSRRSTGLFPGVQPAAAPGLACERS